MIGVIAQWAREVISERAERITAPERELQTERPPLATRADITDLKVWLMGRIILVSVAAQAPGIGALFQFLPRP